jgi:hypothetical protein
MLDLRRWIDHVLLPHAQQPQLDLNPKIRSRSPIEAAIHSAAVIDRSIVSLAMLEVTASQAVSTHTGLRATLDSVLGSVYNSRR